MQGLLDTLTELNEELDCSYEERNVKSFLQFVDYESVPTCCLSEKNLDALRTKIQELSALKDQRLQKVGIYAEKIKYLWDQLQVSEDHKENFFNVTTKLGPNVVQHVYNSVTCYFLTPLFFSLQCENELEQLLQTRRQRLPAVVNGLKQAILNYWEILNVSTEERENFLPYYESSTTVFFFLCQELMFCFF